MKDMIRIITKQSAILLITLVVWFTLFGAITQLAEFVEMKISVGQLNDGDFGYLLFKSMNTIKNFIHFLFGIISLVLVINGGLKIHDTYEMVDTARVRAQEAEGETK